MIKRTVYQSADVARVVSELSHNGTIDCSQLSDALRYVPRTDIWERTRFDDLDDMHRLGAWPPDGRWEENV